MKINILQKNVLTSYLLNIPIGIGICLFTILICEMIIGDKLVIIILLDTYGLAIIAQFIAFLFAIWIGSKIAHQNIINGKKSIYVSFRFSLIINSIIWPIFIIVTIMDNFTYNLPFILKPIILVASFSIIGITFINGQLIAHIFKRNLQLKNE